MANPNLLNLSYVLGKTDTFTVSVAPSNVIYNPSGSGTIYKINSLFISNIEGVNTASVTIEHVRNSTAVKITSTVDVTNDNTLIVIGKETSIYLEEGDSIRVTASANSMLAGLISYEIMG